MKTQPITYFPHTSIELEEPFFQQDVDCVSFSPSAPKNTMVYKDRHTLYKNYFSFFLKHKEEWPLKFLMVAGVPERELTDNFHWNNDGIWIKRSIQFLGEFRDWDITVLPEDKEVSCIVLEFTPMLYGPEYGKACRSADYTIRVRQGLIQLFIPFGHLVQADFWKIDSYKIRKLEFQKERVAS